MAIYSDTYETEQFLLQIALAESITTDKDGAALVPAALAPEATTSKLAWPPQSSCKVRPCSTPGASKLPPIVPQRDGRSMGPRSNSTAGRRATAAPIVAGLRARSSSGNSKLESPRGSAAAPRASARRRVRSSSVSSGAAPDAARLPMIRARGPDSHSWQSYAPNPRTILVIGPGAGLSQNEDVYRELEAVGYDIVPVYDRDYDAAPNGSDSTYLYPPGWKRGTPDLSFNEGKNLATFADDVVWPAIAMLVAQGRGPAAVIAGSRGGQVTVPRLWACGWQGPTLVINGGCVTISVIPDDPVRLLLLTCGRDFFSTKDPVATAKHLRKAASRAPVFLYHNPAEGHMPRQLGNGVLQRLLELVLSGKLDTAAFEGTLPRSAKLSVL